MDSLSVDPGIHVNAGRIHHTGGGGREALDTHTQRVQTHMNMHKHETYHTNIYMGDITGLIGLFPLGFKILFNDKVI